MLLWAVPLALWADRGSRKLVAGEPITSIALSLGYETIGSFSRMFKRTMGVSPSELALS